MTAITRILVATDFTLGGRNAVHRAALLAREFDAQLTLLHVVPSTRFKPLHDWLLGSMDIELETAAARDLLRQRSAEIAGSHDVDVRIDVRVGRPHDELLSASAAADLLVIGQRGRRSIGRMVIGGTADRVLRRSRVPMLVVKRKAQAPYRHVVVPTGLTPGSEDTLRMASALAARAGLQLFHAIDSRREIVLREADVPPAVRAEIRARDDARLRVMVHRGIERLGLDGRRIGLALSHGAPVPSALRRLRASAADLVVVGRQADCPIPRSLLAGISGRLLAEADRDTLIVPRRAPSTTGRAWSPWASPATVAARPGQRSMA